MSDLGHAARLLGLLALTVDELEAASGAFVEDARREGPEGGRLSLLVHLRIESFRALAREIAERLGETELAELFQPDRNFDVRLGDGFVASILAASGDAQIAPGDEGLDPRELLTRLHDRFVAARA